MRRAVAARSVRWSPIMGMRVPKAGARVHLTRDESYSRTGRNVRALCGASVLPLGEVSQRMINGSLLGADCRDCPECAKVAR